MNGAKVVVWGLVIIAIVAILAVLVRLALPFILNINGPQGTPLTLLTGSVICTQGFSCTTDAFDSYSAKGNFFDIGITQHTGTALYNMVVYCTADPSVEGASGPYPLGTLNPNETANITLTCYNADGSLFTNSTASYSGFVWAKWTVQNVTPTTTTNFTVERIGSVSLKSQGG